MAQVSRAAAALCAGGACDGTDGEDGQDGQDAPPPDPAVVRALVVQTVIDYCATGPQCDKGDTGQDGQDGQDGPSVEEVRAMVDGAIADHCAAQPGGTCEGAAGSDGDDGDDGARGVGLKSVTCPGPQDDWIVTFTDDTSQTVPGPCRLDPIIEPSPQDPTEGAAP
jgi:hypothetical protein